MAKSKLRRATRAAVDTVKKAAGAIGKRVEQRGRRRRIKQVLRSAAATAVTTGAGVLAAAAVEESVQAIRRRRKISRHGAFEVAMPLAPGAAIDRLTDALEQEGFEVLSRVDAHTVFERRLGVGFRPFTLLGVANPHLAHRALSHDAGIGLFLTAPISVEAADAGGARIRIGNPETGLTLAGLDSDPTLTEVIGEVKTRLRKVADALR